MNKKILGITVSMLTLAMLVVPVMAGKGQNKMSFELQIFGAPDPISGEMWEPGINVQVRDRDYYITRTVWDISGDWEFLCAGSYSHQYTISQIGGTFTGFGTHPASGPVTYYELVNGTINTITGEVVMDGVYYSDPDHLNPTGYTFTAELTIDPSDGSMEGALTTGHSFVSTSGAAVDVADTFILINEGETNEELISEDYLEYEGKMYVKNHPEQGFYVITVREIIYIYEDADRQILRGTLELVSLGKTKEPLGPANSFVGHGTGEFEGVKVNGNSESGIIILGNPNPPFVFVKLNRVGTVMGWPTP